ncbi:MAG: hypothetical protein D3923_04085 [Candidatus Electrothrix sp. AR3]|nr:hypothetical protein [Candidatus Electrothrix sp. AR3]
MKDIDLFADTNPAFCSLVMFQFCQGYNQESKENIDFPLILLPVPIILSGNLEKTFKHTQINTGFFTWIDRNPELLIGLPSRIEGALELTRQGLEYGVTYCIFEITSKGEICPREKGLRKKIGVSGNSKVISVCKNALRLGQWFGQVRSTATIYNHLGLAI